MRLTRKLQLPGPARRPIDLEGGSNGSQLQVPSDSRRSQRCLTAHRAVFNSKLRCPVAAALGRSKFSVQAQIAKRSDPSNFGKARPSRQREGESHQGHHTEGNTWPPNMEERLNGRPCIRPGHSPGGSLAQVHRLNRQFPCTPTRAAQLTPCNLPAQQLAGRPWDLHSKFARFGALGPKSKLNPPR